VLIGGGIESCKGAPVNIAERLAFNNPDVEIHTFQIGNTDEGRFFLDGIARKCRGTYTAIDQSFSAASWHAWMKRYLVVPCAPPAPPAAAAPAAAIPPILFDHNSFSVRSKDPRVDAANLASLGAVGRLLQAKPSSRVVLHGFTDAKGAPDANLKISRRRAEAVARYLTANHRIPSARISIVPHGFAPGAGPQPAAPQIMEGRRVEIELVD
jgi:outer membrane protein OmpA-like peptidoglycan-associated protein